MTSLQTRFVKDQKQDRWKRQLELAAIIEGISGSRITFGNRIEVLEGHQFFDRFNAAMISASGDVKFCAYEHYSDATGLAMADAMAVVAGQGRDALVVVDGHGGNNHPHTALAFEAGRHTRAPVRKMIRDRVGVRVFHPTWLPHTFEQRRVGYEQLVIRAEHQSPGPKSIGRLSQRRANMSSPFHQHRKIGIVSDVKQGIGPEAIGIVAGIQVMDSVRIGQTMRDRSRARIRVPPTHDTALWIKGPAVNYINLAFLDVARKAVPASLGPRGNLRWPNDSTSIETQFANQLQAVKSLPRSTPLQCQPGGVQIAMSEPTFTDARGSVAYLTSLALLRFARHRVRIVTPCLNLPVEVLEEMKRTTERGVKIEILINGSLSEPLVRRAAVAQYEYLIDAGVHIFELQDGELHDKFIDVDAMVVVGGSQNWNWRSMTEDHEMAAYVYDEDVIEIQNQRYESLRDSRCLPVTRDGLVEARREVGLDRKFAALIDKGLGLVN